MASPETIDQKTNRSYLESGLQPSVGGITPIRNVQVAKKFDPQERRGGIQNNVVSNAQITKKEGQGIPSEGSMQSEAASSSYQASGGKSVRNSSAKKAQPIPSGQPSFRQTGGAVGRMKNLAGKGGSLGTDIRARMKATTVNTTIWSWGIQSWLFFQLPFALLSLVFLMAAVTIDEIKKFAVPGKDDGWIATSIKTVVGGVADAISWTLSTVGAGLNALFGFDITGISFDGFFVAFWLVVMMFGIFVLLVIYLMYKIALLEPFSGRGAGAKHGAFLLALIGYSLPVLNLVPWFIFWTLAVWRYPK
jgi:hypothetical protein